MKCFDRPARTPLTAGFTLIEIIIVIAVIAILAGIATPSIVKNIRDSRIARTRSDCKEVASAMASFYKDTAQWPNQKNGARFYYTLKTGGSDPARMWGGAWSNRADTFENHLITNTPNYPTTGEQKWDGPYQTEFKADPWNHPYICPVWYLSAGDTHPVYVLSAGPDGVLQTRPGQLLAGNDIGFRIQ